MTFVTEKPIAIIHDHASEFNPVAAELWGRDISVISIDPRHVTFDSSKKPEEYSLVFNDLGGLPGFPFDSAFVKSLSLFTRHLESSMFRFTQGRIINGSHALEVLTNRARQISHFASLNVRHPRTLFVSSIDSLIRNLHTLTFPLLIKSNSAGTAGRTFRFDNIDLVIDAIFSEQLQVGTESWLLQELIEPKGGHILRLDILNGNVLSTRKVYTQSDPLVPRQNSESAEVPVTVIREAEHIVRSSRIDLASVEVIVSRKNNEVFFCNIKPFVYSRREDQAGTIISKIGDFLERRLTKIREMELSI